MDYIELLRAGEICFLGEPGFHGSNPDWPLREEIEGLLPHNMPAADVRIIIDSMPHVASVLAEYRGNCLVECFTPGEIGETAATYFLGQVESIWASELIASDRIWDPERLGLRFCDLRKCC